MIQPRGGTGCSGTGVAAPGAVTAPVPPVDPVQGVGKVGNDLILVGLQGPVALQLRARGRQGTPIVQGCHGRAGGPEAQHAQAHHRRPPPQRLGLQAQAAPPGGPAPLWRPAGRGTSSFTTSQAALALPVQAGA